MKEQKSGQIAKLAIILFVFLGLYGCGVNKLTRIEQLELEAAQKEQSEQESTQDKKSLEDTTDTSLHKNENNNLPENSDQDDLISIDEENLLKGYWFIVDMQGEKDKVTLGYDDKLTDVRSLHMDDTKGESSPIEPGYGEHEFTDLVIKENNQNDKIIEAIGQTFESHWDHKYSKKTEIAFKQINNQVGMLRILDTYGGFDIKTYLTERISKSEYDYYKSSDFSISKEQEKLRVRAEELKKKYNDDVETFFGSQSFEDGLWILMNDQSFGEYGKGGEMKFTDQQQSEFIGEPTGDTYPAYISSEFDELYYSFSDLQEYFALSKDEKHGLITLTSKDDFVDVILNGEQEGSLESKNIIINTLLKSTRDKQDIMIKVTDSKDNTYLGISDGKIRFELE